MTLNIDFSFLFFSFLFFSFLPIEDRTMIFQMQYSNITGFQDVFANDCIGLVALRKKPR
jgi:hypothetical protein